MKRQRPAPTQEHPLAKPEAPADPLLAGGTSPALERYRAARADLAEMERDEQAGRLIDQQLIVDSLHPLIGVLRRAGLELRRQFGNEAGDILNEAIDEWAAGATAAVERAAKQARAK